MHIVHPGRLPLRFAYCELPVELTITYPTIVALSAKLTKATNKVHTGCHLHIYIPFLMGSAPNQRSLCNKWKNHSSEMKEDVGMSHHKTEGEQEDAYT